jgi:hypothetical protein
MKFLGICAAVTAAAVVYSSVRAPSTPAPVPKVTDTVAVLPPLCAAAFADKTGSMKAARTDDLSPATLKPLCDRLLVTGGEIGFGLIQDRSNKPLIRVYVPMPPEPPVSAPPVPGNIFVAANTKKREGAERKKYEAARQAWLADATARIKAFIAAVTPLLVMPANARRTDIRSAIERADLFLAEPSPFSRTPECGVILLSDGVDNVNTNPIPKLKSNARVVIANGIGSVGAVGVLSPVRFESVDAAMRYVAGGPHAR